MLLWNRRITTKLKKVRIKSKFYLLKINIQNIYILKEKNQKVKTFYLHRYHRNLYCYPLEVII